MKKYFCLVLDKKGEKKKIVVMEEGVNSLKSRLKKDKYILLDYIEKKEKKFFLKNYKWGKNKITNEIIGIFTYELGIMIKNGVVLSTSLEILLNNEKNTKLKEIIEELLRTIKNGNSLVKGVDKYINYFGIFYKNMLFIGEESGNLGEVLITLSEWITEKESIKKKIKGILIYPIITLILTIVLGVILVTFILPEFIKLFNESSIKLPFITKVLFSIHNIIKKYIVNILIFNVLIVFIGIKIIKKIGFERVKHKIFMKLPYIKKIYTKYILVNFLNNLNILLSSEMLLSKSIEIIMNLSENKCFQNELNEILIGIKSGLEFSNTLSKVSFFNEKIRLIISIGEGSGTLKEMIKTSYDLTRKECDDVIKLWMALLEPGIIIFLGLFIGLIVMALYLPMFNLLASV